MSCLSPARAVGFPGCLRRVGEGCMVCASHSRRSFYFDRQENLTKLLQSLAHDAPQNQVDDLIRHRLREMFKASRKTCYEDVLPLPNWKTSLIVCAGVACFLSSALTRRSRPRGSEVLRRLEPEE